MSRQALTYVEISLRQCSRVYSVAPCQASIPATGIRKCYQARATCQDIANYADASPLTLRFAKPAAYRPADIFAFPFIKSVDYTPAVVSLGKDLGQRASVTITFTDAPDSDTFPGLDPYLSTRDYDPYSQGTFFGKLRARHPFLLGRPLSLIMGYVGQSLTDMETRHFLIDSYEGPTPNGEFTIRASDVLKLGNADKALAPLMSPGALVADITATAAELTVTPAGSGNDYDGGYLNIGGSESVRYWKRGDEAENVLLLHFDGSDASTTFTDSSSYAKTPTAVGGNAQLDTAQFKFGTASGLFDGTGDYIRYNGDAEFAFGTGDFSIDFWIRPNFLGAQQNLYESRPAATDGLYPTLYLNGANQVVFYVSAGARITSGALSTGTWAHVALVRQSGVTRMFINGFQAGSDYADTNNYIVGAGRPAIGIALDLASNSFNGWLDELRITKGYARWFSTFTPPTAAAPIATGTDLLYIPYRGALNSTAAEHRVGDRVQEILAYVGEDPADIIYDLCTTYIPGFDAAWIDLATWQTETANYNGNVYTAYITEPTAVKTLIEELVLQAALAIWWDDIDELLRLQVLRAVVTTAFTYTPDNMRRGTLAIREQLDQRLSQVLIYFGQINPLLPLSNKDNYRSSVSVTDADAEADWVVPAISSIILSRWIPEAGSAVAERLGAIQLGRFKTPPRHVSFEVQRYAESDPTLGGGYHFECLFVQDETGATDNAFIPIQVTQIRVRDDSFAVEAEEMLFDAPAADLTNRYIDVPSSNNANLRSLHDSVYPAPTGSETVTFTLNPGVLVGSVATGLPAIDVGTWPAGTALVLILLATARIEGKGGNGGAGGLLGAGSPGGAGGIALYTRKAITLNSAGEIWGGGGGGGGGGGNFVTGGGGGGGGGGSNPGTGGLAGSGGGPTNGSDGTTEAGGAGGTGVPAAGGAGGNPGSAGSAGASASGAGGSGGAAGAAVDGTSYVTYTASGDIRGGQIN